MLSEDVILLPTGGLLLDPVNPSHEGLYQCVATNEQETISTSAVIDVKRKQLLSN